MTKATQSIFLGLLLLVACGRDRNLDDYNRDKALEDASRMESIEGSYRGTVLDIGNIEVGALQIDLSADRSVDSLNLERSVLKTRIYFSGKSPIYLSSEKSYYDWRSGRFQSEFLLSLNSTQSRKLLLDGKIISGKLSGNLRVSGFDDHQGTFDLSRVTDGQSAQAYFRSGELREELIGNEIVSLRYRGLIRTSAGQPDENAMRATLDISNRDMNPELRFAEIFSPRKTVRSVLTFNSPGVETSSGQIFEDGFSLSFNLGQWEEAVGSLDVEFQSANPGDRNHFSLHCLGLHLKDPARELICSYESSERGVALQFNLLREESR